MSTARSMAVACAVVTVVLLFGACGVGGKNKGIVVNVIADPFIEKIKKALVANGTNVVKLPPFERDSTARIFMRKVTLARFRGYDGTVRDLASLYRIGDVSLFEDNGMVVKLKLGLKKLEFECRSYLVKFPLLRLSGKLKVRIGENRIGLAVRLNNFGSGQCTYKITYLRIENLEIASVKLSGFSVLNTLMDMILYRVLTSMKSSITRVVETYIKSMLTDTVKKSGLCRPQ